MNRTVWGMQEDDEGPIGVIYENDQQDATV